jgi:xanthine dehydrogenase YagT iron-sulfur-binding subunit
MADQKGMSRRSFLKGIGVTTVSVAALNGEGLAETLKKAGPLRIGPEGTTIQLSVNGKSTSVAVTPATTLAEVLRDRLQLTGTKLGCGRGACGACTVILNGKSVNSCMTLALDCIGAKVETVEGLADGDNLHPLQESFIRHDAMQCGFCTSGMLMSARSLLRIEADPDDAQLREGFSGNLCRCGTYPHVFEAVREVSGNKGGGK